MKYFIFLLCLVIVLFFAIGQVNAQVLFRAFHETDPPIPNEVVEDAEEWNKNNVTPNANVFEVADGRLRQTANECAATTKTLLPGVDGANWTNYTVVADVWWRDDDGVSLIFRYTDEDHYYSFTTGGADAHFSNNWFLGGPIFKEEACFLDAGGDPIEKGPTGVDVSNAGPFTMMIRVKGSTIEGFFGPQLPQADLLAGKTPPQMVELDDSTYTRGAAAIGISSSPTDLANIQVFGPGGPQAVDAKEKLTTVWGMIKSVR